MELNQAVATLQDEVKLLKGEIKTVLKEIRTAVLSDSNPFAIDVKPATVRPVPGPGAGGPDVEHEAPAPSASPPAAWPTGPAPQATPVPPAPSAATAGPSGPIVVSAGGPSPAPTPQAAPTPGAPAPVAQAPAAGPEAPPVAHTAGGEAPSEPPLAMTEPASPSAEREPTPLRPLMTEPGSPSAGREPTPLRPLGHEAPGRPPAQRWNLLTIAGLMAWAEDAVATLGPQRFQIALELACFAELLSPEVRDVLDRVAALAPAKEEKDEPVNVVECVLVLHQLEAILQEHVTKLPRRRAAA